MEREGIRKRNTAFDPKTQASWFDEDQKTKAIVAKANMILKKHVVIQSAEMDPAMQEEVIDVYLKATETLTLERDIADHIKTVFDQNHGPEWHCIVGNHFGSAVSHEPNHVIHMSIGTSNVYLYKTV